MNGLTRLFPVAWLALFSLALAAPARAQTQTIPITITCGTVQAAGGYQAGTCSVTPFGPMTITVSDILQTESCPTATLTIQFTLTAVIDTPSGTFSASNFNIPYMCPGGDVTASANISGGTGAYAGATGTIKFTAADEGGDNTDFNGTGTITLNNSSATPLGSGFPAVSCDDTSSPIVFQGSTVVSRGLVICTGFPLTVPTGPSPSTAPNEVSVALDDSDCFMVKLELDLDEERAIGNIEAALENQQQMLIKALAQNIGNQTRLVQPGTQATQVSSGGGAGTIYITAPTQSSASTYAATAACLNYAAACWLTLPNPSGNVDANARAAIPANINLQGLAPGLYTATVSITSTPASGDAATVIEAIGLSVAPVGDVPLTLSETGLQFQAVSGVGGAVSQSIAVSNGAGGTLPFTASASTLTGGHWLTVTQTPSQIQVQANPAGLAPGVYFGQVNVTAAGASNSPQSAEVVLTVLPSTASTGPMVSPAGLVFVAQAGGANPAAQTIQVSNPSNQPLTISASTQPSQNAWFAATASGTGLSSVQPLTESVSVNTAGLPAGVYRGTLDINAAETNSSFPVAIVLVVTPASGPCTPTQLLPVFTNLADTFQTMAGLPVALQAEVIDDCGSTATTQTLLSYFPEADPGTALAPLGNGMWAGTWLPHNLSGGAATVGLLASSSVAGVYGSSAVAGTIVANPTAPLISPGQIVSGASYAANTPLAPGSFLTVKGANLATGATPATALPYPTTLGTTQVFLGGEALPLQYAGSGQINAVVPYDLPPNQLLQLWVAQNGVASLAEPVILAPAAPAVFTQDSSGSGAGVIADFPASGGYFVATPSTPASAGDTLVIYATGLGAVSPDVPAGSATPLSPYSQTVSPVTVSIGGQTGQVTFAGLSPTFAAGVYQINVVVPSGIAPSPAAPLVVTTQGISSPPVTIAIQ